MHIPNYMPINFQGHRSKVKVTGSKTSIFSFLTITKKIIDRFSPNKSPNTQCGLACMVIVLLSLTLKAKVTVKGHRSPDSEKISFSRVLQLESQNSTRMQHLVLKLIFHAKILGQGQRSWSKVKKLSKINDISK